MLQGQTWWRGLLDLLWPEQATCDVCGAGEPPLCAKCRAACLVPPRVRCCSICTRPFAARKGNATCSSCQEAQPFDRVVSLGLYEGALKRAITRMKYYNRSRLAQSLGRELGRRLEANPKALLVPVPLHRQRQMTRGYNQALLIAHGIADLTAQDIVNDWVVRDRATGAQAQLGRAGRLTNMAGAFRLRRKGQPPWEGRPVWIVDDVLTTGATACSLSQLLLQTGAVSVQVAVLAVSASPVHMKNVERTR